MNALIRGTNAMRLKADSNTNSISTNTQSMNENKRLVAGRYEICAKLGQGSFGEVRLAKDIRNKGSYVAIKLEHKSDIKQHLKTEYRCYTKLTNDVVGFPNIYWFGKYGDYTCLVMDRLGASLKTLYAKCNRIFPVQTVALIAVQLLDRLETLHDSGWLHQDLKPENICIGYNNQHENNKQHTLYLIDYGTSDEYLDPGTKKHRIRTASTKIVGTARYSSLNNHYGYKQSRRDDLESLGYTLIYFLLGRLPWQGIDEKDFRVKWKKVRKIKRSLGPDDLCRGLPVQFRIYLKYVFKLQYTQRPNYGYLRGLFRNLIVNNTKTASNKVQYENKDSINSNIQDCAQKFAWEKFGIIY